VSVGFLDLFRKRPRAADWAGLEDFVARNASFIVNRTMYEYARARAGLFAEKLFREPEFQAAIEANRWKAFPIGVGVVAELSEGRLRPHCRDRELALVEAMVQLAGRVVGRYPVPPGQTPEEWDGARDAMQLRLRHAGLAAPKAPQDVPDATFPELFALMPIHPDLMKLDFEVVRNNMRGTMFRIADSFAAEVDAAAVAARLR